MRKLILALASIGTPVVAATLSFILPQFIMFLLFFALFSPILILPPIILCITPNGTVVIGLLGF